MSNSGITPEFWGGKRSHRPFAGGLTDPLGKRSHRPPYLRFGLKEFKRLNRIKISQVACPELRRLLSGL